MQAKALFSIVVVTLVALGVCQPDDGPLAMFGGGKGSSRCEKTCERELKQTIKKATSVSDASKPTFLVEDYSPDNLTKICEIVKNATSEEGCFGKCEDKEKVSAKLAAYTFLCEDASADIAKYKDCFTSVVKQGGDDCKDQCMGVLLGALLGAGGPPTKQGGPPDMSKMMGFVGGMCKAVSCMIDCGKSKIASVCADDVKEGAAALLADFGNVTTTAELGPLFQLTAIGLKVPNECRKLRGEAVLDEPSTQLSDAATAEMNEKKMAVMDKQMQVLNKEESKLTLEIEKLKLEKKLMEKKLNQ